MKRILVVDDDPMICTICRSLLTEAGYEAITQPSGIRCMSYLRNKENPPVQLIILDVEMPSMNGIKTLASIRQSISYISKIPVMFLTSSCSPETVQRAITLGVNEYLKKPFDNDELLRRVEKLLANVPEVKYGSSPAPKAEEAPEDTLTDASEAAAEGSDNTSEEAADNASAEETAESAQTEETESSESAE